MGLDMEWEKSRGIRICNLINVLIDTASNNPGNQSIAAIPSNPVVQLASKRMTYTPVN